MKTIRHLNAAIRESGRSIEIDETRPHAMCNGGVISLYLDQDDLEQFAATNCCAICVPYYDDVKGSRSEAIRLLIQDIEEGFEPMTEDTAHAAGVEMPA